MNDLYAVNLFVLVLAAAALVRLSLRGLPTMRDDGTIPEPGSDRVQGVYENWAKLRSATALAIALLGVYALIKGALDPAAIDGTEATLNLLPVGIILILAASTVGLIARMVLERAFVRRHPQFADSATPLYYRLVAWSISFVPVTFFLLCLTHVVDVDLSIAGCAAVVLFVIGRRVLFAKMARGQEVIPFDSPLGQQIQ